MRRINRIIFQETRGPILIALAVLTFVVFTREFGRLAELLIRRNTEFETVSRAVGYLLPSILVFTVPFAFLIGALIGFGRLSADSEIVALRTGGLSSAQLLRPVLVVGLLVTIVTAGFVHYLPEANWQLRLLRHEMRAAPVFSAVKPRVFFEEIPGLVLYVADFDPATSTWERVLLSDQTSPGETRLTLARSGQAFTDSESRRLQLHLEDGVVYTLPVGAPDRLSVSRFGTLDIPVDLRTEDPELPRAKRPHDKRWSELMADLGGEEDLPSRVELHRRVALPLSGLVFALLVAALGVRSPRSGRSHGFLVSLTIAFSYFVAFATGSTLARNGVLPIAIGVWGANLLMLAGGLAALWFADHESRSLHRLGNWRPVVRVMAALEAAIRVLRAILASVAQRFRQPVRGLPGLRIRMARVVDLYLSRTFLVFFLTTVISCLFLVLLFTFFEIVDDVFRHQIAYSTVVDYFFFLQPHLLMLLIPISILIATLMTFGTLERSNQVIAFKSCGVSVFRIAAPILVVAAGVAGFSYLMQEYVLPYANQRQDNLRNVIKGNAVQTSRPGPRWIFGGDGRLYHYSHYVTERRSFGEVTAFTLDPGGNGLAQITYAGRVDWDSVGKRWELRSGWWRDLAQGRFGKFDSRFEVWAEGPDFFAEEVRDSSKMTYLELRDYIEELQIGGYEVEYLRTELHKKISFPAVNVIMALLGVPFALTMGRRGALYGIAAGVLLGIGYWGAFGVFDVLGSSGLLAPALAAWAPNFIFGALAALLLSGVRT